MAKNKLGTYITQLMTTALDKEQEEFVRNLAWSELKRIHSDIGSFLSKHETDDEEESTETVEKMLLLEKEKK
tara:strand:+ start:35 stop:250 length:216 start_codon:yes stop_codon:yes gene_type:complete